MQEKFAEIQTFTDLIVSTSSNDIKCEKHEGVLEKEKLICDNCNKLQEKVRHFQTHRHTFSCEKKKKFVTIKEQEGFGRLDGKLKGPVLRNVPICRYNFPKFPMNETILVLQASQELNEEESNQRKLDLKKIKKFLIRQRFGCRYRKAEQIKNFKFLGLPL